MSWRRPTDRPRVAHVAAPATDEAQPRAPAEPAPVVEPQPSIATPRDRYHEAQSIEASEPTRALAIYAALAPEGGTYGAAALFAEAELEDRLGHHDRARSIAEDYLSRYPEGINADAARLLLGTR